MSARSTALPLVSPALARLFLLAGLAAALAIAAPARAAPVEVAGVKLEDSLELRGTPLQLNGAC